MAYKLHLLSRKDNEAQIEIKSVNAKLERVIKLGMDNILVVDDDIYLKCSNERHGNCIISHHDDCHVAISKRQELSFPNNVYIIVRSIIWDNAFDDIKIVDDLIDMDCINHRTGKCSITHCDDCPVVNAIREKPHVNDVRIIVRSNKHILACNIEA